MKTQLAFLIFLTSTTACAASMKQTHADTAKKAAAQDHKVLFDALCMNKIPSLIAESADWYAKPQKVFDNLYYVGQKDVSAWAVTTSDGIIIIDPLFGYSVEREIIEGLKLLGLDPKQIKYVVISHAHEDHVGGARYLQDRGAKIVMSEEDWNFLKGDKGTWEKPKRDVVASDGYKLVLGDTELVLVHTPGHTPGSISTILPLKDGKDLHIGALWGGTAFNWKGEPRRYNLYAQSARKFKDVAQRHKADVILSNHALYDKATEKIAKLAKRKTGEPHPFVIGEDAVLRFLTVAEECALARGSDRNKSPAI